MHGSGEPRELALRKSGRRGIPLYQQLGEERDYHFYVAQYDAEIRYLDQQVERLLDTLDRLGLYDDAVILFTSDHGESMGEHDFYFVHGQHLYSDLTRVPLILKSPGTAPGARSRPSTRP